MKTFAHGTAAALFLGLAAAGTANAAEIFVSGDITTSTTWTADNTYNLQGQIYVLPGATLTIEAGTVIASTTNGGGSLAITNGADIIAEGTVNAPIIFTSKADVATWTGGDPTTGTWRESALEWGNLTIMGDAYIGSDNGSNTPTPNASNVAPMEGLTFGGTRDEYGGGNDDDDSGTLKFVSLRYGGKVVSLTKELNGLSLGGIGRGTDISYVEIMNNVDDGIEIWGGTVELDHVSIWNIGDDSLDVDQGWRGKTQFGLIVQGYSLNQSQGSGVGDNAIETDGAEDSDFQPVTTAAIYNYTVIGQPFDGDGGTAWRDNARVQYRNCIWMDLGDELVRFDGDDGDGASGYGHNGTLSWADTWSTSASATSTVNPFGTPGEIAAAYQAQDPTGNLAEIRDSVFYNNLKANAYTEAIARGVLGAGATPANDNLVATVSPIKSIARESVVFKGGKLMARVISLDPRAAGDAVSSVAAAPNDGFFVPANFRGAFDATDNWLCNWTAADAFGFIALPAEANVVSDPTLAPGVLTANGVPSIGNNGFGFTLTAAPVCGIDPAGFYGYGIFAGAGGPLIFPNAVDGGCTTPKATSVINIFSLINPLTFTGTFVGSKVVPLPIPNDASFCGARITFQGGLVNLFTFEGKVTEGIEIVVGL